MKNICVQLFLNYIYYIVIYAPHHATYWSVINPLDYPTFVFYHT